MFGINSHQSIMKNWKIILVYQCLFFAALIVVVRRIEFSHAHSLPVQCLFLWSAYTVLLMQIVNYGIYSSTHVFLMALQGRYLFPVDLSFLRTDCLLCSFVPEKTPGPDPGPGGVGFFHPV